MYNQMKPKPSVGFMEAGKLYFNNYADFEGRARRSEYWKGGLCIGLFSGLGFFALSILSVLLGDAGMFLLGAACIVCPLVMLVPSLSLCVRRLHDVGKSGWWYLLGMVPFGNIVLFVWFCTDSKEDNKWGPNPKYDRPSAPAAPAVHAAPVRPASVPVQREIEEAPVVTPPVYQRAYAPVQGQTTQTAFAPQMPATAQVPVMEAVPGVYGTLQLYSGPMAGKNFRFPEGSTVTIGRSQSRCQVALPGYNVVSGEHCRITICNNYINITDLGSTNGTFVNGIRLTPHKTVSARPGATIYLANNTCAFRVIFE